MSFDTSDEIRMECLRFALESKMTSGEDVVELARLFEAYVTGRNCLPPEQRAAYSCQPPLERKSS